MSHGKRKRSSTETIIETSKCSQKSLSDYFGSTSEGEIISTVCDEVNVGLSTPTTTLTCNPPSFFSGDNVKSSKCYDVGTFRNQMFDAKAGKCDVVTLKMDLTLFWTAHPERQRKSYYFHQ